MKKNDSALNILIPSKLYADAKAAADNRNISLAALVRMALTEWLVSNGTKSEDKSVDQIFAALKGNVIKGG